jgi:hypothetical protein
MEASTNKDIKWIIVLLHKHLYSSLCGNHDSCDQVLKLREPYHLLFEKYGVNVVISGHAHNYQRTYPLFYNEKNSSEPMIQGDSSYNYNSPKGMVQIIVGTGGIDLDNFSNQMPYVVYQQDYSYGFLDINVVEKGNKLIGKYYSNKGKILDEFVIVK